MPTHPWRRWRSRWIVAAALAVLAHAAAWAAPPAPAAYAAKAVGRVTGFPLPRFVSLRSDDVNLRAGPGLRYRIKWVLHRRLLPVQVVEEFKEWRAVRLPDGTTGWVHSGTVSGRRGFVVKAGPMRVLRAAPARDARPVARLRACVVGRILSCAAGAAWCRLQVGGYRGYLRRDAFWGTFEAEGVTG